MNLPDEAIKEFQSLYKSELGKEISWDEAKTRAESFLRLFKLISKPIPVNNNATLIQTADE